jgi:hypothetical protein
MLDRTILLSFAHDRWPRRQQFAKRRSLFGRQCLSDSVPRANGFFVGESRFLLFCSGSRESDGSGAGVSAPGGIGSEGDRRRALDPIVVDALDEPLHHAGLRERRQSFPPRFEGFVSGTGA